MRVCHQARAASRPGCNDVTKASLKYSPNGVADHDELIEQDKCRGTVGDLGLGGQVGVTTRLIEEMHLLQLRTGRPRPAPIPGGSVVGQAVLNDRALRGRDALGKDITEDVLPNTEPSLQDSGVTGLPARVVAVDDRDARLTECQPLIGSQRVHPS